MVVPWVSVVQRVLAPEQEAQALDPKVANSVAVHAASAVWEGHFLFRPQTVQAADELPLVMKVPAGQVSLFS
jgi:hypothetical protein